jgi:hypothetical protein
VSADRTRAFVDRVFGEWILERDVVFDGPAVALSWVCSAVFGRGFLDNAEHGPVQGSVYHGVWVGD